MCNNQTKTLSYASSHEIYFIVDELFQEPDDDPLVENSEDDLEDWRYEEMNKDKELHTLLNFVFVSESDEDRMLCLYYIVNTPVTQIYSF